MNAQLAMSKRPSLDELRQACLRFDRTKRASIGGEQEQGFEQAFSSLAYAYIKDKAPRLLDHVVGFQLVDRNEDNTKAVGVFGFQVGNTWIYAPVFFLNGDLKGHELLYIKNQDSFVPMKENWVNYLVARKPHILGERSPQDTFQMGGLSPSLERLSNPPERGKYASDRVRPHLTEWARGVMPMIAACATKQARFLYRGAEGKRKLNLGKVASAPFRAAFAEGAPDLQGFLSANVNIARGAHQVARRLPGIKLAFDKFYGRGFFQQLAQQIKKASQRVDLIGEINADAVKAARDRVARNNFAYRGSLIADEPMPLHPSTKVAIVTSDDVSKVKNTPELTDDEKATALQHGYLVKDERTGEEVSKAYDTQVEQRLVNPHETGLYQILEKPGTFDRMLAISHPHSNSGRKDMLTIVRIDDDGAKAWVNAHRTGIFSNQNDVDHRADYEKWFEDVSSASLEKGGLYIAVGKNGDGSVPFEVRESYGDGAYKVDFKERLKYTYERTTSMPPLAEQSEYHDWVSPWGAKLIVDPMGRAGTAIRSVQGELYIPEDFKFFKLKSPPKPKKTDDSLICEPVCCDDAESEEKPIHPGKLEDIQILFTEKTAHLKLYHQGSETWIKTAGSNERHQGNKALFELIARHGFTEKAAKAMLAKASLKRVATFRVKYAYGYPFAETAGPGPGAPAFPGAEMGSEAVGYQAYPAMYPQQEFTEVDGLQAGLTDPSVYDPFMMPDQQTMQMAQEAGQTGQKEVFDTAMISGMLKAVRQDSLVDRYLGDLMKALDKLGRILFMFYWHGEEFEDRYGKQDLPELEDSLRNAFEVLGDVVLFLKEKTIEPAMGDTMGDPDIQEAARN